MKLSRSPLVWVVIVLVGIVPCAAAQSADAPPRIEAWGSLSMALTGWSGALAWSYSPPYRGTALINTATQTLTIEGNSRLGFQTGANFFLFPHAGFQILVDSGVERCVRSQHPV